MNARACCCLFFLGLLLAACTETAIEDPLDELADDATSSDSLDAELPDGTQPDGTEPDTVEPDGGEPDGSMPDAIEPLDCFARPLDACADADCMLFEAAPYDVALGCFTEPTQPAFCKPIDDILCDWEGDPVILATPNGASWYVGWSCFSKPPTWTATYVPEGRALCGAERDCLDYGVDDCEAAGCTLFEAFPYDADGVCYDEPARPAFCQLASDIDCDWEGNPVVLTEANGSQWYVSWSCFTSPDGWTRQELEAKLAPCDVEPSCLELPVEDCVAAGCELMLAHPYDAEQACFEAAELPAFCRANPDVVCGWEGDPIILTEPSGEQWYIDWSCFTTPPSWTTEFVPGGAAACE